jgi:histidyl-tRNA synthetase
MVDKVKGVRDFTGRKAFIRQQVLETIRKTYELFGFEPIETPAFEYLSLFTDKSGPEIESQLYSFEDKKGEKLALRPEHTVSKLRVVSSDKSLIFPLKAYSIGNVWRYDDVRKGRWREFIQADIDVFGSPSIFYDSEIIACIDFALKKIGVKGYIINVSNRKILTSLMQTLELKIEDIIQVLREIDKIHKVGLEEVITKITAIIGVEKAEKIKEYLSGSDISHLNGFDELTTLISDLKKSYGIDNVIFDRSLVRGQDYYDGTIFEFEFTEGKFKGVVMAGGGRYDKLSKNFDSDLQIVGGAIGFDVIMETILENDKNEFQKSFCVINIDSVEKARDITMKLREAGIVTDVLLDKVSLSKGLDYCNSKKIKFAIIVGDRDIQEGKITVRDLDAKKDIKLDITNLEKELLKIISYNPQ